MTEAEIRSILGKYRMQAVTESRGNGTEVGLAWFEEIPGCLAEAPTRRQAIAELEGIAPAFVEGMLSDGGSMPLPLSQRPPIATTSIQKVSNLVLGDVRKLQGILTDHRDTATDTPSQFARFDEHGQRVPA